MLLSIIADNLIQPEEPGALKLSLGLWFVSADNNLNNITSRTWLAIYAFSDFLRWSMLRYNVVAQHD